MDKKWYWQENKRLRAELMRLRIERDDANAELISLRAIIRLILATNE